MKTYSVMCFGVPDDFSSMCSVEVQAVDVNGAKTAAVKQMNRMGYPNAVVAPEIPGAPVVIELNSLKKYSVKCFPGRIEGARLYSVEVQAADAESAKKEAVRIMVRNGYPDAFVPAAIPGMESFLVREIP